MGKLFLTMRDVDLKYDGKKFGVAAKVTFVGSLSSVQRMVKRFFRNDLKRL